MSTVSFTSSYVTKRSTPAGLAFAMPRYGMTNASILTFTDELAARTVEASLTLLLTLRSVVSVRTGTFSGRSVALNAFRTVARTDAVHAEVTVRTNLLTSLARIPRRTQTLAVDRITLCPIGTITLLLAVWAIKSTRTDQLTLLSIPTGRTTAASCHRVACRTVLTVARMLTIGTVSVGIALLVALVPRPTHPTLALSGGGITDGACSTVAHLLTVIAKLAVGTWVLAESPRISRVALAFSRHVNARRVVHAAADARTVLAVPTVGAHEVAERAEPPGRTGASAGQYVAGGTILAFTLRLAVGAKFTFRADSCTVTSAITRFAKTVSSHMITDCVLMTRTSHTTSVAIGTIGTRFVAAESRVSRRARAFSSNVIARLQSIHVIRALTGALAAFAIPSSRTRFFTVLSCPSR